MIFSNIMDEIILQLRQEITQKRRRLSIEYKNYYQQKIAKELLKICENYQRIAFYYPVNGEVDVRSIWNELQQQNKQIYLPKTIKNEPLSFLEFTQETVLYPELFNIPVPQNPLSICSPNKLDLVIVPALAVDPKGLRIGMGGGYYDRTFAHKIAQQKEPPFLLGLVWDFQVFECALPTKAWDIKLDAVLSENQVKFFNS